jgi:hypothetical protein
MTAIPALAADTPEEAMTEQYIFAVGERVNFLSYNGESKGISMHYYSSRNINGVYTDYPAYCINPQLPGPSERGTYKVNTKDYMANPKIWGIVSNGYPYKTIGELGVHTGAGILRHQNGIVDIYQRLGREPMDGKHRRAERHAGRAEADLRGGHGC